MKTSLKKYLAVITRTDGKIPSRVVTVNASTAAVAVKRAKLKAQAEFPRYKVFDVVVDTITPRKAKRVEYNTRRMRNELIYATRAWLNTKEAIHRYIDRLITRRERAEFYDWFTRKNLRWHFQNVRFWECNVAALEEAWLQVNEIADVINAE